MTGVAFTDPLPDSLVIAGPSGATNSCGGSVTALAGSASIRLSGATIAASSVCSFSVNVTTPLSASSIGTWLNVTSAVTSDQTNDGAAASADLTVTADPYLGASWFYWYVL